MTTLAEAVRRTRREIADAEAPVRADLVRRYGQSYRAIDAELRALTRRIEQAIAAGEDVHPDWIRRQGRYRNLLASIDTEMARFGQAGRVIVGNGQAEAVGIGRTGAAQQAQAAGYAVDVGAQAPIVPAAQDRLVSALQPGSPLVDTLGRYDAVLREAIERELFTGIVAGHNPREVLRRIRATVDGPMLHTRLEALTRTEMMRSLNGALSDQLPRLGVTRKLWVASLSSRTCPACMARHMTEWDVDATMDAHPMCFPAGTVVNGPSVVASSKRWYSGQVVNIRFGSGDQLTVTPNHPILTSIGWVAAGQMVKGMKAVRHVRPQGECSAINPNNQDRPAFIEDVAESFPSTLPVMTVTVPTSAMHFHGDGAGSEVSVIRADRLLGHALDAEVSNPPLQDEFSRRGVGLSLLSRLRSLDFGFDGSWDATGGVVRGTGETPAFFGAGLGHTCVHGLGESARSDASSNEAASDGWARDAEMFSECFLGLTGEVASTEFIDRDVERLLSQRDPGIAEGVSDFVTTALVEPSQLLDRLAGSISLDDIVDVEWSAFSGHVYNLQTTQGWYSANTIITHNCRCSWAPMPVRIYPETRRFMQTGDTWLRSQPITVQQQVLGSADAVAAFRRGDVSLSDFVGVRYDPQWGRSIYAKSGSRVLRERGRMAA